MQKGCNLSTARSEHGPACVQRLQHEGAGEGGGGGKAKVKKEMPAMHYTANAAPQVIEATGDLDLELFNEVRPCCAALSGFLKIKAGKKKWQGFFYLGHMGFLLEHARGCCGGTHFLCFPWSTLNCKGPDCCHMGLLFVTSCLAVSGAVGIMIWCTWS